MSAEKFRVVIYTNTCEKKVTYIPATEDINIAIMRCLYLLLQEYN